MYRIQEQRGPEHLSLVEQVERRIWRRQHSSVDLGRQHLGQPDRISAAPHSKCSRKHWLLPVFSSHLLPIGTLIFLGTPAYPASFATRGDHGTQLWSERQAEVTKWDFRESSLKGTCSAFLCPFCPPPLSSPLPPGMARGVAAIPWPLGSPKLGW